MILASSTWFGGDDLLFLTTDDLLWELGAHFFRACESRIIFSEPFEIGMMSLLLLPPELLEQVPST